MLPVLFAFLPLALFFFFFFLLFAARSNCGCALAIGASPVAAGAGEGALQAATARAPRDEHLCDHGFPPVRRAAPRRTLDVFRADRAHNSRACGGSRVPTRRPVPPEPPPWFCGLMT
jgi:hypothetical protein